MRAEAWSTLSGLLYHLGAYDEGYYAAQEAFRADAFLDRPQDILTKLFTGAFEAGDDDAARLWCARLNERHPSSPTGAHCSLTLLAWVGSPDTTAFAEAMQILSASGLSADDAFMSHLELLAATVAARAGAIGEARSMLRQVRERASRDPETLPLQAGLHLALGQQDSASAVLRDYVAGKPETRRGILTSRRFDSLRR